MIVVSVGTFAHGFDELVWAADAAAGELGIEGFAQIGHSRVVPDHLSWKRFLPHPALLARLRAASVVVCHGGAGIVGEAMRAGRPIVAVPRRGAASPSHPANDQLRFLERLAETVPIIVCRDPAGLTGCLRLALGQGTAPVTYPLGSDVPALIAAFLGEPQLASQTGERPG